MSHSILVVEDDREMGELVTEALQTSGKRASMTSSSEQALESASRGAVDLILTDIKLNGANGLDLCEKIRSNAPDVPVIVMTGFGSMDTAIAAIRAGAYDFITKPISPDALTFSVERALDHHALQTEVKRLRERYSNSQTETLVGESREMQSLRDLIARIAVTDATVLITGESGTGKELVARSIHNSSDRAEGHYVVVNCAAMPENLLESELFGHTRGAFTDAKQNREGLFVRADGGTLFLDEIGEMPLEMQAKLLRVLQERKVRPVGANEERSFDTRIICATNRDLKEVVDAGEFREDLFYRINVLHVEVPPLRNRGNDIFLLAQHFLEKSAETQGREVTSFSPEAAELIRAYDWPGNARELQNAVERAVALARFEQVMPDDLPPHVQKAESTRWTVDDDDITSFVPLKTLEERYVRRVLNAVSGNKTKAAKILGLDRRTLYRKLDRFNGNGARPD